MQDGATAPALAPRLLDRVHDRPRRSGLLVFFLLFVVYALGAGTHARPGADLRPSEAHVLLTAESIVSNGDVELSDEYRARAWRDFYDGPLTTNALAVDGRLTEMQGIVFPALVTPAYALGGPVAVQLFLAAIAALGFALAAALGRRLVPDPWATGAALAVGLSPPAVVAATTIAPAATCATLIAGAAGLALRVRDEPLGGPAAGCAALLALVPWISPPAIPAAAVVTAALVRWLGRRRRAWTGLVAIEIVFVSLLVWVTVSRNLFGGLTPYSASTLPDAPTGLADAGDVLDRLPRAAGVLVDPQVGVLIYAPVLVFAGVTLWSLARQYRERLSRAFPGEVDVEIAALLLAAICAATVLTAIVLLPSLAGRAPGEPLVVALPCAAALCAWALRRHPRAGLALALVGIALSLWMLVGVRLDDGAGLSPVDGAVPWSALGDEGALR